MQAIIICATTNRLDWLNNCLASFKDYNKYPIISLMVNNGKGYIPDFLREILKMNIEEFVLLQDSMEIKDASIFDICFELNKGKSVSLSNTPVAFGSTHGKFLSSVLSKCSIPQLNNKYDDALYEVSFGLEYLKQCEGNAVALADLKHSDKFEYKFGRNNMVVENEWIKKYKGTWTIDMAKNV